MINKPTALFIDDDHIEQTLYRRVATRLARFESIELESYADEALAKLIERPDNLPDIIFLDLNIPRMSGLEFVAAIEDRMPDRVDQLYIVIATTSAFEGDRLLADQFRSVYGFFTKPLLQDSLSLIVEQYQEWSQSRLRQRC